MFTLCAGFSRRQFMIDRMSWLTVPVFAPRCKIVLLHLQLSSASILNHNAISCCHHSCRQHKQQQQQVSAKSCRREQQQKFTCFFRLLEPVENFKRYVNMSCLPRVLNACQAILCSKMAENKLHCIVSCTRFVEMRRKGTTVSLR